MNTDFDLVIDTSLAIEGFEYPARLLDIRREAAPEEYGGERLVLVLERLDQDLTGPVQRYYPIPKGYDSGGRIRKNSKLFALVEAFEKLGYKGVRLSDLKGKAFIWVEKPFRSGTAEGTITVPIDHYSETPQVADPVLKLLAYLTVAAPKESLRQRLYQAGETDLAANLDKYLDEAVSRGFVTETGGVYRKV